MNEHFIIERINYCKMAVEDQISLEEAYIMITNKLNLATICDSEAWHYYHDQTKEIQFMITIHYMYEKGYEFNGDTFTKKE